MLRLSEVRVDLGAFSLEVGHLHVREGEYLVILGTNGAGKTVLLETIAGLHGLHAGRVELRKADGWQDLTGWPAERRGIGFVYQDYLLFPHLSVEQNIRFGLHGRARGDAKRARVREIAALTGVTHLLGRRPAGLSGGEQQKVALARALAIRPDVLLLDEPLAALDRTARRDMAAEVKRLCRDQGVTVLHVTHGLEEAVSLGDEVAVLGSGRVLQVASPDELLHKPVDRQVAELVGCENLIDADADGSKVRLPGGLELRSASSAAGKVTVAIRPEDLILTEDPSLFGEAEWNVLSGEVERLVAGPAYVVVELSCQERTGSGKVFLKAFALPPDVTRKALRVGSRVWVVLAAERVHLCV